MPMSGNTGAVGNNIKGFAEGKMVEKGSDPMPRERGPMPTSEVSLNIKDFNKNETTAAGVQK